MYIPLVSPYLDAALIRVWAAVTGTALVLNGVLWYVALRYFPQTDPATVLHYSIGVGIDFIGEGKQIIILPLLGAQLIIFNLILGVALLRANQRAAWVLWSTMPVLQAGLLVAFYLLWRINL